MSINKDQIIDVLQQFGIKASEDAIREYSVGHIHKTYLVQFDSGFILQKINTEIFPNLDDLSENIFKVLNSIDDLNYPQLVLTADGKYYYSGSNLDAWRLYTRVPNSISYNKCESAEYAYQAANVVADFQQYLNQFSPDQFHITIPKFHDLNQRLKQLLVALDQDKLNRKDDIKKELEIVEKFKDLQKISQDKFKIRITHNDLKFNNILFDCDTKQAKAVVDYDTVMPGLIFYDYGDLVRSTTATVDENEKDLRLIDVNLEYYKAIHAGYLEKLSDSLDLDEKDQLALSPSYMAFILAVRFLTDYLQGDQYFPITYTAQNLNRAQNQFCLLQEIDSKIS